MDISINIPQLRKLLRSTPSVVHAGLKNASHDILNTWQADARNEAPIDRGVLRKEIAQKLEIGSGLDAELKITSNVYRDGFNYAYYQHEVVGDNYLERSAENNLHNFEKALETEIKRAIRDAGW